MAMKRRTDSRDCSYFEFSSAYKKKKWYNLWVIIGNQIAKVKLFDRNDQEEWLDDNEAWLPNSEIMILCKLPS